LAVQIKPAASFGAPPWVVKKKADVVERPKASKHVGLLL
jgi:hypothetical protein